MTVTTPRSGFDLEYYLNRSPNGASPIAAPYRHGDRLGRAIKHLGVVIVGPGELHQTGQTPSTWLMAGVAAAMPLKMPLKAGTRPATTFEICL
jgi:hypothetical protein